MTVTEAPVARMFVVSANGATVSIDGAPNLSVPPYGGDLRHRVSKVLGSIGWTVVSWSTDQGCAIPTRSIVWPGRISPDEASGAQDHACQHGTTCVPVFD